MDLRLPEAVIENDTSVPIVLFLQEWTPERVSYLGEVLQKDLKQYTEAAVGLTTGLITLISRFVVQVPHYSISVDFKHPF